MRPHESTCSAGAPVSTRRRPALPVTLTLVIAVAIAASACGDAEPRSLGSLVQREGRYLDPDDFRPYTGPVFSTFRDEQDAVEMTAHLVEGRLHGQYERFYRDGTVFGRGAYRDGAWDGPFESFYRDGTLWMEGRYEGGSLDGPYVAYAEDGTVQERGTYVAGAPCGTWIRDGEEQVHPDCPEEGG